MQCGAVEYINALPYVLPLQKKLPLTLAPPACLNTLLREGHLQCVLSSSVLACQPNTFYIKEFGIASQGPVLSVHLYSPCPPTCLSGRSILLDPASETSVALLRLLCRHHWKISPRFVMTPPYDSPYARRALFGLSQSPGAEGSQEGSYQLGYDPSCDPSAQIALGVRKVSYDAYMLIGDAALKRPSVPGYCTIDLASAWYEMTQLPFVFALFTSLQPLSLLPLIQEAWAASERHFEPILDKAAAQTGLPRARLLTYYQQSAYPLNDDAQRGFTLFKKLYLSENHPAIDSGAFC